MESVAVIPIYPVKAQRQRYRQQRHQQKIGPPQMTQGAWYAEPKRVQYDSPGGMAYPPTMQQRSAVRQE